MIRLIDIDGQAVLEMQAPGLLPFTPLMKPPTGMDISQWVQECVNAVSATPVDQQTRGDLLCAISLFGSIVHDVELFKRIISEELMPQSKSINFYAMNSSLKVELKGFYKAQGKL